MANPSSEKQLEMKQEECWRWRYRARKSGRIRRTSIRLFAFVKPRSTRMRSVMKGAWSFGIRRRMLGGTMPGVFSSRDKQMTMPLECFRRKS